MKSIFKYFMLVAVAAMSFVSCEQASDEISIPEIQEVVMTINAGVDETRTYIDETDKIVKWSEGDNLKVIENSKTYRTTTKIDIDADGLAKFTVSFPANNTDNEFTYNAIFPADAVTEDDSDKVNVAKVKVTVKDQQMPTATSFDPEADVLVAKQIVADAQPTELNMQFKRLVALGKMTLNNFPDANAEITKVVFTAGEKDVLAGRNYVNATTGEIAEYGYFGKTNTITLNYIEPITTRDIYFTCNPFEMEAGETFTVKAYCKDYIYTREVTIPDGRSLVFTAGNLGTFSVDMKDATKETNTAFAEGKYMVIAKSDNKYYAMKGVKGSSDYMTYAEVTYDGEATTISTSDETLVWDITAVDGGFTFQNNAGKYLYGSSSGNKAYLGDAQTLTISPIDYTNQYKIAILEISERILAFNANSGQERFAFYKGTQVNNLYLVPVGESNTLSFEVSPGELLFDSNGDSLGDDFFEVTSSVDGFDATNVTATTEATWFEIEQDGAEFTILVEANSGAKRTANIVFSAEGYSDVTVTVSQEGVTTGDSNITVAEFLELKDTNAEYTLTGKITRVVNTSYGNFDLTDETGTVYVYGLLTPEGASQKQWAAAGLREGDTITIKGKYSVYNNSPQIKNAIYVSHVAAPFIEATAVTVEAAKTTATMTVSANVKWTVSCDATWVTSYTQSGSNNGTIAITMEANESEEDREATFTFSAEGVDNVVVKLTQKGKPAAGELVGGSADFQSISSTNTSYVSGATTAGWNYKNCAIFKGGTSDNSPAFKMIGDASNRALCMNGKTSAVGSITSPTLTTGCGTLTFNYGLPFGDNQIKFRVDIKQNGTVVNTFTVTKTSASKLTKYSHEEEVNIAGDFQIIFTNLSPSNSTSNKDRTAIWDVEWTGYGN